MRLDTLNPRDDDKLLLVARICIAVPGLLVVATFGKSTAADWSVRSTALDFIQFMTCVCQGL